MFVIIKKGENVSSKVKRQRSLKPFNNVKPRVLMITNMYTLQLFVQVLKTGIQDHIGLRTRVAYRLEEKYQVA